mgnify:CR=1 FL=1
MRIALISDIHGNLAALQAVLRTLDREQVDRLVCLGDVAAMGPQPREALARLRGLAAALVMGNADAELLDPAAMIAAAQTDDARRFADMTQWAANQLDDADRAFIASFQPTVDVPLPNGQRLLCCHGSPRGFDDVIVAATPDEEIDGMVGNVGNVGNLGNVSVAARREVDVIAGGHTHIRMLRAWRGREIVNPGSVGLAYRFFPDGSVRVPAWAEFAIVAATDEGTVEIALRRVPYDQEATVRAMHERGMPHAAWWSEDWR